MGVIVPSKRACRLMLGSNSRAISISSKNTFKRTSGMCSVNAGSLRPFIAIDADTLFLSARSINSSRSLRMSYVPMNSRPRPIGQDAGVTSIAKFS